MTRKIKEKEKSINKKEKKKVAFNLKDWIKMVIEKSSNKRNKVPKIEATFQMIVVEADKHFSRQVVDILKDKGSKFNMSLPAINETNQELKLLSILSNEVDLTLSLMPAESVDENFCLEMCDLLKNEGVEYAKVYSIVPSSADLNLIYLLRKGV